MPRPCNCGNCHLCWLAMYDSRYRQLWGLTVQDLVVDETIVDPGMSVAEMIAVLSGPPLPMPDGWDLWPVTITAHQQMLSAAATAEYQPRHYSGSGIVCGAGGNRYFRCAWAMAAVLRYLGCQLPIEFWYLGRSEMDDKMLAAAESVGIQCVDAGEIASQVGQPRILGGWELKPFSVLYSRFADVIYIDADCVPVRDPQWILSHPRYLDCGAVFWPDLPPGDRPEWLPYAVWEKCGIPFVAEVDLESGQFAVSKSARFRELMVTMHLNSHSDWYYRLMHGDKSTYHLAWRKCGTEYALAPEPDWVWPAVRQRDFDGNVAFEHLCGGKSKMMAGERLPITHAGICVAATRELARMMPTRIWDWVSGQAATALVGRYTYRKGSLSGIQMNLEDDGEIGLGWGLQEQRWAYREFDGEPTIIIVGEAFRHNEIGMAFLTRGSDGAWRGRLEALEKSELELVPC